MSSMTGPTNPGTITVADGHVVHTCCGKLDSEPHRNFCEHFTSADKLIEAAVKRWDNYRDGYANGYLDAIAVKSKVSAETLAAMESFVARRDTMTDAEQDAIRGALGQPKDDGGFAARWLEERQRRTALACPEWCTIGHAEDDDRGDLALHMGDDHTDGYARRLLNVHEGSKLLARVARTDDLAKGTAGVPALLVTADLELTTWEQAGELARTILDAFGYLEGADRA